MFVVYCTWYVAAFAFFSLGGRCDVRKRCVESINKKVYMRSVIWLASQILYFQYFSASLAPEDSDKRSQQTTRDLPLGTMGIIEKLQASMPTKHYLDTTRADSELTFLKKSNSTAWSSATLVASTAPLFMTSSMSMESTSSTVHWTRPHPASPSTPQEASINRQPGAHRTTRGGVDDFFLSVSCLECARWFRLALPRTTSSHPFSTSCFMWTF